MSPDPSLKLAFRVRFSMGIRSGQEAYESLAPIMNEYGAKGPPEKFYEYVNRAFHEAEAKVYDDVHQDMWRILPHVVRSLILEATVRGVAPRASAKVLDVGCGTGLATTLLMQSDFAGSIGSVVLLDPSLAMLKKARERVRIHAEISVSEQHGLLDDVPDWSKFDLIIASSVLHHVPDLPMFFAKVEKHLMPGGMFLHLQDPNASADESPIAQERRKMVPAYVPIQSKSLYRKILSKLRFLKPLRTLKNYLSKRLFFDDHIRKTNDKLLAEGVIQRPMRGRDIWFVTDIHVGEGLGLTIGDIQRYLPDCSCIAHRTYEFFGLPAPDGELGAAELKLLEAKDPDGNLLAGLWLKSAS